MALIQKNGNANLITLAAKSNPIAFFATDKAAQDAYDNNEIPEGTIVFTKEDAESNLWVDFTPYSSNGLSNISIKRREEGGLVHYTGTATTTSSGSTVGGSITLLNDNSMVIYKNVTSCTQANGTGWPLNVGKVTGTNVLTFSIVDASRAGGMKVTVAFDVLANK